MRILLVNANTSSMVTDKVLAGARAAASPGTEVVAVTGTFGARVIATRSEHAIAEHSTIALVARHAVGCDAVVIAVSYDTAARAARELLPIPVVGMTEAALLTGCLLGGRLGMVVIGRRVLPMYQELVDSYGLSSRIAAWRTIESKAAHRPGADADLDRLLVQTSLDLIERDFAEVVVLTGAVMAGAPARLQPSVPVPLLDGIACGVRQAELLVRSRYPKPTTGSYAAPGERDLVDVDSDIAARFRAPEGAPSSPDAGGPR
ncbi:MAG: aspartate/glutamate racemase family protein [Candidatus Rokuibacteriota bacterium]